MGLAGHNRRRAEEARAKAKAVREAEKLAGKIAESQKLSEVEDTFEDTIASVEEEKASVEEEEEEEEEKEEASVEEEKAVNLGDMNKKQLVSYAFENHGLVLNTRMKIDNMIKAIKDVS